MTISLARAIVSQKTEESRRRSWRGEPEGTSPLKEDVIEIPHPEGLDMDVSDFAEGGEVGPEEDELSEAEDTAKEDPASEEDEESESEMPPKRNLAQSILRMRRGF